MTKREQKLQNEVDEYLFKKSQTFKRRFFAFMFPVLALLLVWMLGLNAGRQDVTVITEKVEVPVVQTVFVETTKGVSNDDIAFMALTVQMEARSESMRGQMAVAHVINNRYKFDRRCDTISEVVTEPYQFSVFNRDDPNFKRIQAVRMYPDAQTDVSQKEYAVAWKIAHDVLTGRTKDPTGGATMYLNPKKVKTIPEWFKQCSDTKQIGAHHFCYYESGFCNRG